MTLMGAILKKVKSTESANRRYISPPPEMNVDRIINTRKKRFRKYRYVNIEAKVDSCSPKYNQSHKYRNLHMWKADALPIFKENMRLLFEIKNIYDNGGPKVVPTAVLQEHWRRNRQDIVDRAQCKFVLFPPIPREDMEDPAFVAAPGVTRPRVHLALRVRDGANLGSIAVELFTDVCPVTCELFLELLDGDGLGHGYVGTRFFRKAAHPGASQCLSFWADVGIYHTCPWAVFTSYSGGLSVTVCHLLKTVQTRCIISADLSPSIDIFFKAFGIKKVPHLYWSGGDVIMDNGFGCYLQRGRRMPIPAENYHFSHSMPGLLSMKVTRNDEVCGIFNVTFKPLPQFDLHNVVFGRV